MNAYLQAGRSILDLGSADMRSLRISTGWHPVAYNIHLRRLSLRPSALHPRLLSRTNPCEIHNGFTLSLTWRPLAYNFVNQITKRSRLNQQNKALSRFEYRYPIRSICARGGGATLAKKWYSSWILCGETVLKRGGAWCRRWRADVLLGRGLSFFALPVFSRCYTSGVS